MIYMDSKAPWYTVVYRLILLFFVTAVSYIILILNLCALILIYDTLFSFNLQSIILNLFEKFPVGSIIVTVIGYIVWSLSLVTKFVRFLVV